MSKSNYIAEAIRTESIEGAEDRTIKISSELEIVSDVVTHINTRIDDIKKYIFYGKQSQLLDSATNTLPLDTTSNTLTTEKLRLLHAGLGMLTEAAEFLEPILLSIVEGKELDKVNLKEEIGDIQWYEAIACNTLNTTFEEEQARNIAKLKLRYPDKFTSEAAINRDVEAERKVLEHDTTM